MEMTAPTDENEPIIAVAPADDRAVAPEEKPEEVAIEVTLRPQRFEDYVGQEQIKTSLNIAIQAAKKRSEPIEHLLLYGNPGLGKTTLAHIIAKEMGVGIRLTAGPAIERAGDLAAILSNLEPGDILFIDEIHRLPKTIEEVLYPAMEEYAIDLVIGKGPAARTLRLDLPKFTLIGATTKMSLISAPLRDRFGHAFHLNFYTDDELIKILNRSASILNTQAEAEAIGKIAQRSRRTPRIANRLLKRVRDYSEVHGDGKINTALCDAALALLAVDHLGLDTVDRAILTTIIEKFNGGPVGLSTVAAATAEEVETIEHLYEPFLMQLGLLQRTPRGRMATPQAYAHLGKTPPEDLQQRML